MSEIIKIILTEDGSPTAYFQNENSLATNNLQASDDYQGEKMHHSGGAWGESVYIFGPAIQWGFSKVEIPYVISLGTGLAYNEIITTAFSLIFDQEFQMHSYEKNPHLNSCLKAWVLNNPCELQDTYDLILQKTAQKFELSRNDIKQKLLNMLNYGSWQICEEFPKNLSVDKKFHVILYDFFSSKAMEYFWTQGFLENFLDKLAMPNCAFATYACTGNLKRSLKTKGFKFFERRGYLWKRASSFAMRKT